MALPSHRYSKLILTLCGRKVKHDNKKVFFRNVTSSENNGRQIPREKPALRKRSAGGGGYPLLIIPVTTFALGTWQIYRREWKLNLIKELEEKVLTPPIPLPENLEDLKGMEYRRVKIRGRFDHSKELFIGPRSNVHDPQTMGQQRASNIGVHVVTPFKLADRDETILVNRGHVSFKNRPHQLRQEGQVDGEVEITGVVRLSEKKSMYSNDPMKDGYWLSRDVEEMADIAETSPVFVDADIKSTVPGGPQGGQTRVNLRNEHMSYIITWYSLTVLVLWLWYKNYRTSAPNRMVLEMYKNAQKRQ